VRQDLLGLDGCKKGAWVAARPGPHFEIVLDLAPLLAAAESGQLRIVLDVPIGLCAAGRSCDAEARRLLGRRASSVFTPPCRAALCATSQADASRLNLAAGGKGIGCQGFGILSRIATVDALMRPELQRRVHEGHPEVSFAVVRGAPMEHAKRLGKAKMSG
jgi:predicted RNase H-like nuclease